MADVSDLYEPNGREPGEPDLDEFDGSVPVDLEEIEAAHEQALLELDEGGAVGDENTEVLLRRMLPLMVADLREARERIARFEALETRMEIVAATGHPDKAGLIVPFQSYVKAAEYADKTPGCQVFYRYHSLHPWQEIDPKAPF